MKNIKLISYKNNQSFDWFGWFMTTIGLYLIMVFSGLTGQEPKWILTLAVFFVFIEYVVRVLSGKTCKKITGFDTIINTCYDLDVEGEQIFVAATTPEELDLYMMSHHAGKEYKVVSKFEVESFIKTEENL
jgi:hypothetical protein